MSRGCDNMIEFQKPYKMENAKKYLDDVLQIGYLQGDGKYTKKCQEWMMKELKAEGVYMMTSCTHALECAVRVLKLKADDEVIMPSFTFPSTANAVVLTGAKVIFSEVTKKNLTIDVTKIEEKISPRTKAIIVVHYGGASCDMAEVMAIATKYNLLVIEDSAQSFLTKYKNKFTGTIGDIGCFSFHGTKDFVAGEGGAIIVNDPKYIEDVEIFRQKGTNRSAFIEGRSKFYEWVGQGSSYSPSELTMATLFSQLELKGTIMTKRQHIYKEYLEGLTLISHQYKLKERISYSSTLPNLVNGHLFYILFESVNEARAFSLYLAEKDIETRGHFVPLHESLKGKSYKLSTSNFIVEDNIGQRLVRLPIYPDLQQKEQDKVLATIHEFFEAYKEA